MRFYHLRLVSLILLFLSSIAQAQETTPEPAPQAGDTRTDAFGIEQVYVPAGCFMMGSSEAEIAAVLEQEPPPWVASILPAEQPQHEVCITQGYWIDKYEVTHAAYQAFIEAGGYTTEEYWSENGWRWVQSRNVTEPNECAEEPLADDLPQVCVTWYEADAYARWRGGSLPTEAQWEYAARGTDSLVYPWGNEWDASKANVVDSAGLQPVGSYPAGASWVGALDMAGNAMEWVNDWLDRKYYETSPKDDPTGPEKGTKKAEKGGWWGSNPFVARSAYKHYEDPPGYNDHHIGFRIVSPELTDSAS